jgi:hypothetical protein
MLAAMDAFETASMLRESTHPVIYQAWGQMPWVTVLTLGGLFGFVGSGWWPPGDGSALTLGGLGFGLAASWRIRSVLPGCDEVACRALLGHATAGVLATVLASLIVAPTDGLVDSALAQAVYGLVLVFAFTTSGRLGTVVDLVVSLYGFWFSLWVTRFVVELIEWVTFSVLGLFLSLVGAEMVLRPILIIDGLFDALVYPAAYLYIAALAWVVGRESLPKVAQGHRPQFFYALRALLKG